MTMARTTHETRFLLTARDLTKRAFVGAKTNLSGIKRSVTGLHGSLVALAGVAGFGLLTRKLIDVNAEFQTIKSSLKTVTGSAEAASLAFDKIERFATTTPFDLQQVTQAFIKLKAFGLDPSEQALSAYGNTASGMGKSLDQMIEAVADATTGEFERLKEFGIRASKQGDQVAFTFQGITKTVQFNARAIEGYLQDIGKVNFGGAMSDQMQNLTPAFSNFNAAIAGLAVEVGEAGLNDTIADLTNKTTAWVESLDPDMIAMFTTQAIGYFEDLVETIDFVTDSIGRTMQMFEGALPGAGDIPAGSPRYQLGDFNRAQGPQSFEEWAEAIRDNTRVIQDQNNGARAG